MQVKNIVSRLITSDIVNSMRARAKVSCRRGSESAEMAAWERRAPFSSSHATLSISIYEIRHTGFWL